MTSTPTSSQVPGPVVHAAWIKPKGPAKVCLFLRETGENRFQWFLENADGSEAPCPIEAESLKEALRIANKHWRDKYFNTFKCGFRYTLPERDEIGRGAFFYEMVASYKTMTGVYFDEKVGHNCIVNKASSEALDLWHRLEKASRL